MSDRVVRSGCKVPSPFLRSLDPVLLELARCCGNDPIAADLGCGNGRNSKHILRLGYHVSAFDLVSDYGTNLDIGHEKLPLRDESIHLILLNYVVMFLDKRERDFLFNEVKRVACSTSLALIELYPSRRCRFDGIASLTGLREELSQRFLNWGWKLNFQRRFQFVALSNRASQCLRGISPKMM